MSRIRWVLLIVIVLVAAGLSAYLFRASEPVTTPSLPAPIAVLEAPSTANALVVYKSPTCGCCADWVDHLEAEGFTVDVHDREDMNTVKSLLGVPRELASCHTATVGDYVIEGHVAATEIKRLLAEKPTALGLAVPGMPIGSPGMEMDDKRMPYDTLLFDREKATVFASHGE
ncbi:MAG: metal-binding protein [Acinetobacter sp.]|nr:metal-binding protein [Acinetobacter sp.]